jgi:hypothetical protein
LRPSFGLVASCYPDCGDVRAVSKLEGNCILLQKNKKTGHGSADCIKEERRASDHR